MSEILKMLNGLSADELDSVIMRATIMLEKKRKEEAERARLEKERLRQERIAQEKRRQEEIAELQRKLKDLQNQRVIIPDDEVQGDNFVMRDSAAAKSSAPSSAAAAAQPAAAKPAPAQSQAANMVSCPHCHQLNDADSLFCANCGQRINKQSQPSTQPASNPSPRPQPVQQSAAQVRYADESRKKWEMLPGETVEKYNHDIQILQPDLGRKFAYSMEVTNKRILITRVGTLAKSVDAAFGLAGSLVRDAAGAGPKPWLEIPLTAIKNCGLSGKKEFFIEADQTYVLKNKGYERFLPQLVWNAKMGST